MLINETVYVNMIRDINLNDFFLYMNDKYIMTIKRIWIYQNVLRKKIKLNF